MLKEKSHGNESPCFCRIVQSSPLLARRREFAQLVNLTTVDVMAVRLWLDQKIPMATPSNVAVSFDDGVGATFFDLTILQVAVQCDPSCPGNISNSDAEQQKYAFCSSYLLC